MAGRKKKSRRYRSEPSQNPRHTIGEAGRSIVEEEAEDFADKPARKGKREAQGIIRAAKCKKGQGDPEFLIKTNRDRTKQSQDHHNARGPSSTQWNSKKKQPRYYYLHDDTTEEDMHDDTTEEEWEDNSEYNTAEDGDSEDDGEKVLKPQDALLLPGFLFEENNAHEDEGGSQDTVEHLQTRILQLRHLQELLDALDDSTEGDVSESAGAYKSNDQPEKPKLRAPSWRGGVEPNAEKGSSDSTNQMSMCIPGTDQISTTHGRHPGFSGSADLYKETSSQVSGSEECTEASAVAKHSSYRFGLRSLVKGIVRNTPFKFLLQNDVEKVKVPLPTPNRLSGRQNEASSIQVATPEKDQGRQYWSEKFTKMFQSRLMGYSYDGQIIDHKMCGYGRLMLRDGDFIAGNWYADRLMDLAACRLHYNQKTFNIVKRLGDYLLTIYEDQFVAIVTFDSIDDVNFNKPIRQLKESFFEKLTTQAILQDELTNRRKESLNEFEVLLNNMTGEHADPVVRAKTFVILRKYSSSSLHKNVSDFLNDPTVPPELKNAALSLDTDNSKYLRLNKSFTFLKKRMVQLDLRNLMANIYKCRIENHRQMLISRCPGTLPTLLSVLGKFCDSKIIYITRADIDVFDQLANQPFFQRYEGCIKNLVDRFGQAFDNLPTYNHPSTSSHDFSSDPSTVIIPIMSPVLEFLVKSLWEIISEIIEAADDDDYYDYDSMLKCNSGHWVIQEEIKWAEEEDCNTQDGMPCNTQDELPSSCKTSAHELLYQRSLEAQYKLIFDILKHVFPDSYILNKRLNCEFHVLEQDSSQQNGGEQDSSDVMPNLQTARKTGALPERFKDLSEGRLVWLYILDHTIDEVFKDDPQCQHVFKRYEPLLQGVVRFVERSPTESQEAFRALVHSVVKLVTSSAPYIRVTAETQRGVDLGPDQLDIDVEILLEQISTASKNIDHDPLAFSSFRDLITEYNKYLSLRHFLQIEAAPGYFSSHLSQMMKTFMHIVDTSLKKSVPTTALVTYFRCLNDFVDDFRNIDFLKMWYIKTLGYYNPEAMEKVDNKLSERDQCSYRVTDIEKFVAEYQRLDLPPPHHYIIQIVHELLGCIEKCLDKRWQSDDDQLPLVQLKTAGILLDATRRSFMYLKEQPDYVDFKAFKKESVDPFVRLVDECSTLIDLKNRANIVKESFWYLRKMDEIDVDQAMILLRDANTCQISDKLLNCYNMYLNSYNEYTMTYSSCLSDGYSHSEGLDAVKKILKDVCPLHFSEWNEQFKTEAIPVLLAGLSAIWSILVSKDVSSGSGKFLKPHCIQILCILRLLSVDEPTGPDNHLAQVLTGQGKSVILGLLSSVLALTGHKVRVLCYSQYLSSRDEDDFDDFFQTFGISNRINYGTFEDMANEFLNPLCNGTRKSLRRLVKDRVLNHVNWSRMGCVTIESKNTVLLIDEVDVFFTENFYGNTYGACIRASFKGLAVVQEKIWSLAVTKQFSRQEMVDHTMAFIRDEAAAKKPRLSDLADFLSKPGTFSLLESEGENLTVKDYTNQTLFDEHLLDMVGDALSVAATADNPRARLQFKINSEGRICGRTPDGMYTEEWRSHTVWNYLNTFNYFRLKGSDYDHKNYDNYGYLHLRSGRISYSRLPSQFSLILGVSGTIKNLSEYEKTGIKSYNINNTTILPSFYGESSLLFSEEEDFHYYADEQEWLKKIYIEADRAVQSSRAVLIFFQSDLYIGVFAKQYKTKFGRINEMTKNMEPHLRDAFIEEAGLPGAVTLATRGMGRGVDYKSSLSVEKHGGVQVIQTFYSTDIKEEIQIKGRTARKDNKGSYEIVICKKHLVDDRVIPAQDNTAHNYATLDAVRQKLSVEKGKTVFDKINRSERDHQTTMEYFGLA